MYVTYIGFIWGGNDESHVFKYLELPKFIKRIQHMHQIYINIYLYNGGKNNISVFGTFAMLLI